MLRRWKMLKAVRTFGYLAFLFILGFSSNVSGSGLDVGAIVNNVLNQATSFINAGGDVMTNLRDAFATFDANGKVRRDEAHKWKQCEGFENIFGDPTAKPTTKIVSKLDQISTDRTELLYNCLAPYDVTCLQKVCQNSLQNIVIALMDENTARSQIVVTWFKEKLTALPDFEKNLNVNLGTLRNFIETNMIANAHPLQQIILLGIFDLLVMLAKQESAAFLDKGSYFESMKKGFRLPEWLNLILVEDSLVLSKIFTILNDEDVTDIDAIKSGATLILEKSTQSAKEHMNAFKNSLLNTNGLSAESKSLLEKKIDYHISMNLDSLNKSIISHVDSVGKMYQDNKLPIDETARVTLLSLKYNMQGAVVALHDISTDQMSMKILEYVQRVLANNEISKEKAFEMTKDFAIKKFEESATQRENNQKFFINRGRTETPKMREAYNIALRADVLTSYNTFSPTIKSTAEILAKSVKGIIETYFTATNKPEESRNKGIEDVRDLIYGISKVCTTSANVIVSLFNGALRKLIELLWKRSCDKHCEERAAQRQTITALPNKGTVLQSKTKHHSHVDSTLSAYENSFKTRLINFESDLENIVLKISQPAERLSIRSAFKSWTAFFNHEMLVLRRLSELSDTININGEISQMELWMEGLFDLFLFEYFELPQELIDIIFGVSNEVYDSNYIHAEGMIDNRLEELKDLVVAQLDRMNSIYDNNHLQSKRIEIIKYIDNKMKELAYRIKGLYREKPEYFLPGAIGEIRFLYLQCVATCMHYVISELNALSNP